MSSTLYKAFTKEDTLHVGILVETPSRRGIDVCIQTPDAQIHTAINLVSPQNTLEDMIPPHNPPFYSINTTTQKFWLNQGVGAKAALSDYELKEGRLIHPYSEEGLRLPYQVKAFLCPEEWQGYHTAEHHFQEHFLETGEPLPYIAGNACPRPTAEYIEKTLSRQNQLWHIHRAELLLSVGHITSISTKHWHTDEELKAYGYYVYCVSNSILHWYWYKGDELIQQFSCSFHEKDHQPWRTPASSVCGSPVHRFILRTPPPCIDSPLGLSPIAPVPQEYSDYIKGLSIQQLEGEIVKKDNEFQKLQDEKTCLVAELAKRHSVECINLSIRKLSLDISNIHAC